MIRFFKEKYERIRSKLQRPILKTGEYLDQFIVRSALMLTKQLIKYARLGVI